jgi:DNA-binding response OmpR family regulator
MVRLVDMRLTASGYEVISANNGIEGLKKAENESPDLILLDIKMPQMDGHTALRNLKRGEKTKAIPVIILTGYDKLKDLFDLEGAKDYIVKPFDGNDLLARISKILKEEL